MSLGLDGLVRAGDGKKKGIYEKDVVSLIPVVCVTPGQRGFMMMITTSACLRYSEGCVKRRGVGVRCGMIHQRSFDLCVAA